jgi:hypothetical protein
MAHKPFLTHLINIKIYFMQIIGDIFKGFARGSPRSILLVFSQSYV